MRTHDFVGVSYHPRDKIYLARVGYRREHVWLRTYRYAEDAARVRDLAARWLIGPDAKLNFPREHRLPAPLTPADVVTYLREGGVPLRVLVQRVPLLILRQAGISNIDLIGAGADANSVLACMS